MGVDLVDITAKQAALFPERVVFDDVVSGASLTYRALDDRAARAAAVLAALGVGEGDRVAVLCRNRVEFFEILFACGKLGAILAPLNWRMPPAELDGLLLDCTPKALVYGREDAEAALALERAGLALLAFDDGYEAQLAAHAPFASSRVWRGDDAWCLLYTSGTTGQPKAVIQTYQMALVNHVNASLAFDLRRGDCTLNFLPLFHAGGIHLLSLPTLIAGGTVRVLPAFDAGRVADLLERGAVDIFFGVPAVYQELALHPRFAGADFSRVRSWGCGGAPLPDVLVEAFAAKGVRVRNGYGMTETGPTAFIAREADALTKIGSVGQPQALLEARIVDAQGREVAPGETGEIWMRGPGITPGYWRRPEATAEAFSGGWLKSGDLGRMDADGCYYVVGRIKDMYISGGENVYAAEVENVLARHPAVLEAAVIGVADERWGEVGHAFVLLRPDAPRIEPGAIIAHCRCLLARYKTPQAITFVDDFPRTPTGKVRKNLLVAHRANDAPKRLRESAN